YEDDVPVLMKAGGRVIGEVGAHGGALAGQDSLDSKAAAVAAESGGTHFIVRRRSTSYVQTTSAGHANTTCSDGFGGGQCNKTYPPPVTRESPRQHAHFVVIRLAPAAWAALPEGLRPKPAK